MRVLRSDRSDFRMLCGCVAIVRLRRSLGRAGLMIAAIFWPAAACGQTSVPTTTQRPEDSPIERQQDYRAEIVTVLPASSLDGKKPMLILEVRFIERHVITREEFSKALKHIDSPAASAHDDAPPKNCRMLVPCLGELLPKTVLASHRAQPDPVEGYAPRWVAQSDAPELHRKLFPDASSKADEWHAVTYVTSVFEGTTELLNRPLRILSFVYRGAPMSQIDKLMAEHGPLKKEIWKQPRATMQNTILQNEVTPAYKWLANQEASSSDTGMIAIERAAGLPEGVDFVACNGRKSPMLTETDMKYSPVNLELRLPCVQGARTETSIEVFWSALDLFAIVKRSQTEK